MKSLPRKSISLFGLGLMLLVGAARGSAQTQDSEQISQLLAEAKSHALEAESDAALLDSYTRSGVSWKAHANKLQAMKEHVNGLGKIAGDLGTLESQGSPWQQQAIREVTPLLQDMATNLTGTIQHLNQNPSGVRMQPFRQYTRTNYELAKRTADLIRDFVDYDEAKANVESLEQKLEIAQK